MTEKNRQGLKNGFRISEIYKLQCRNNILKNKFFHSFEFITTIFSLITI